MQNLTFVYPLLAVIFLVFVCCLLALLSGDKPRPSNFYRSRRNTSVWLRLARRIVS